MRKAKGTPSFDYYLQMRGDNDETLVTLLKGHLVIEALLVELIQLRGDGDTPWRWNFPKKTEKCVEFGFIRQNQADVLNDLNNLRNDFAHILGHTITIDLVFDLTNKAASAGFEFSDDTLWQDRQKAEEDYGIHGCIVEVLNSLYVDLAMTLRDNNGPDRISS